MSKCFNKIACLLSLGFLSLFLISCASDKPPAWKYQPEAIQINVSSPTKLNTHGGLNHSVMLKVVQVSSLKEVQSYLRTSAGLAKLLSKEEDTVSSKDMYLSQHYIYPGHSTVIHLTRMAGIKHVVLIVGFNRLNPKQVIAIFNVPLEGHMDGFKFWKRIYKPAALSIDLNLGNHGIISATGSGQS